MQTAGLSGLSGLSPLPRRISSDLRAVSMSISLTASASLIRSPARHRTAINARDRSPWRVCPARRMTTMISSGRGGSGGYCIPLLCGARAATYHGVVAGERRRPTASTNIEPEHMTSSLPEVRRLGRSETGPTHPRRVRSQRPAVDPLPLRRLDLAEDKPVGVVSTPARRRVGRARTSRRGRAGRKMLLGAALMLRHGPVSGTTRLASTLPLV